MAPRRRQGVAFRRITSHGGSGLTAWLRPAARAGPAMNLFPSRMASLIRGQRNELSFISLTHNISYWPPARAQRCWGFGVLRQRGCTGLAVTGRIRRANPSGPTSMPLRALLYRRPTEPQAIELVFDGAMYLVRLSRHRRARRYTLRIHAATREVVLTMPPRGNLNEAKAFAEQARRLDRGAARPSAEDRAVRARHASCRCATFRTASCTGAACAARCGASSTSDGNRLHLRCRRGAARRAPRRRLPQARGQARPRGGEPALRRRARRPHQAHHGARPVEPLGIVLDHRRAVVLLAARARAALRARLPRGARGRAPGRDEPLAAVLAPAGSGSAPTWRAPRRGSTRTAPTCIATARRCAGARFPGRSRRLSDDSDL